MSRPRGIATALALILTAGSGLAQEASSTYARFDLKSCTVVQRIEETGGVVQRCQGAAGLDIFVAEDDLRYFVGYGPNGRKQRAFEQTLLPFNSIGETIEYRTRPGARKPFAAILRYRTADEDGKERGQVLVVTKIEGREACHMAYIDALANPNANALARQTADSMAARFDCAKDQPKPVGATGKSRM